MRRRLAICGLAAAALLSACGHSPPTNYYVLKAEPPASGRAGPGAAAAPVCVAAVHLPSLLDRLGMVRSAGGGKVDISDQDRWAAPLDDMTRRVLAEDLAARLGGGEVVFPRSPKPKGCRDLVVDVQEFQPAGSGRTILTARWSLIPDGGTHPSIEEPVQLADSGGADAASEVAAMSRLLGRLADRIAARAG